MNTQISRQTVLNEYINAAISAFLSSHPDTELQTVINAIGDAKADAGDTFKAVLLELEE